MKRFIILIFTSLLLIWITSCDGNEKDELLEDIPPNTEQLPGDDTETDTEGDTDTDTDSDTDTEGDNELTPIDGNTIDLKVILDLVNQARTQGVSCDGTSYQAVAPLTWNTKLETAALRHSQDMESQNYFSHTSADGRNLVDRVQDQGYNYRAVGENIAKGHPNEEAVVQGWLNSQGHCANIMSSNFTEMGVGRSGEYWTQDFGKPLE